MKEKQKNWLITGASSGIGRKLTEQLLQSGEKVAALVRQPNKLDDLATQFPHSLFVTQLDLTDVNDIPNVVADVFSEMEHIDVVVSSAGYGLIGAVEELSHEEILQQLTVNMLSSIFLIKATLPLLRMRKTGHIIQISSEGAHIAYPGASIYHASKWGIEGFCEALAVEVRSFGIHVTIVEPGRVKTEFDDNAVLSKQQIAEYRKSAVGNYLRLMEMGKFPPIGDPVKVASAIIATTKDLKPPLRLTLGSDAYKNMSRALEQRLQALYKQEHFASITDFDEC